MFGWSINYKGKLEKVIYVFIYEKYIRIFKKVICCFLIFVRKK